MNTIFRYDNGVHDQHVGDDFPLVFAAANECNCRVIECDGRVVSHAALFPCRLTVGESRLKMGIIVLVATDSAYRHRGFAAALMRDLQQTMHDDDYDLGILWTGVPEFYRRLGWQTVVPSGSMVVDLRHERTVAQRIHRPLAADESILPFQRRRHLSRIMELHHREPVFVERSAAACAALLELPKMQVSVLQRNSELVAYAVFGQAHNKRGVTEYGGDPDDILTVVTHELMRQDWNRELPLLIHGPYQTLARRWRDAGGKLQPLECSKGKGCEMVYIVRHEQVSREMMERIFVWGLDVA